MYRQVWNTIRADTKWGEIKGDVIRYGSDKFVDRWRAIRSVSDSVDFEGGRMWAQNGGGGCFAWDLLPQ